MLQQRMLRVTVIPAIALSLVLIFLAFTVAQPATAQAKAGATGGLMGTPKPLTETMPITDIMAMQNADMGHTMQLMGQMMQLMGIMHDLMMTDMMTTAMAVSDPMMDTMMGQMMQLMNGHRQTLLQSCDNTMKDSMPMTGTMVMTATTSMTAAMPMGNADMSQMMMHMTQMMTHMQTMMGSGMGAMGSSTPMTYTMPTTSTMPMHNAGVGQRLRMMGLMMQMMGTMQNMMSTDTDYAQLCAMMRMMNQMMGAMPSMASGTMPMNTSNQPFDLLFIDSMIMHHQGAIDMAKAAQQKAEHPELKKMADDIITAQAAEIQQMQAWRTAWYPNAPATQGLGMEMGTMKIADDPSKPFDLRFIEAMIPHHEGAIAMAKAAQAKAEHPEIKTLAGNIIEAQQKEIAQMKAWQTAWFK